MSKKKYCLIEHPNDGYSFTTLDKVKESEGVAKIFGAYPEFIVVAVYLEDDPIIQAMKAAKIEVAKQVFEHTTDAMIKSVKGKNPARITLEQVMKGVKI